MLGKCDRIVVGKDQTTIVTNDDCKEALAKRILQIRAEAEATDNKFDKEKATERVAALGGGIARIKVGAATETELKDKKLRYEDALNSVRSAIEMGVVPGGGACMLYMSCDEGLKNRILDGCTADEDERLGVEIMFRSLSAPVKVIYSLCLDTCSWFSVCTHTHNRNHNPDSARSLSPSRSKSPKTPAWRVRWSRTSAATSRSASATTRRRTTTRTSW
jgi:hypothetical protein